MKKRTKRTTRKRRGRRSRRMPSNTLLKQMRYFKHKLVGLVPVQLGGGNGNRSNVIFARYDYAGIIGSNYGINSPARWAQVAKNYEQYAVTGFKVKYIPTSAQPIIQNGAVQPS